MPKKRIFIAIQTPEELKNAAEFYLKPFFGDRNLRIPKKEGWHITVVFCGYFDEREIEELKKITEKVASEFKPFEIFPSKILFVPSFRPRMIWLDFKNSSEFAKLKMKIEEEMIKKQKDGPPARFDESRRAGEAGFFRNFRQEMREPHPHLTLSRFKESYFLQIKNILPREGVDLSKEANPFPVENIDIMESHLSRQGADYELLTHIGLK